MKTVVPVALAAILLSGCSTLDGLIGSSAGAKSRGIAAAAAPGTAVSELPTTIQRAAETAWAGRDYGAAASHYAVLYGREPTNLQFAARYAEAARRSGDPKTAAEVLEPLAGKDLGGAPLQVELAKANLQLGRGGAALVAAQRAVAKEPGMSEGRVVLGLSLDAVGEHAAAAAAYQEALAKGAPNSARILNNLALSLAQAGKLNESVAMLRKANRMDGELASISENLNFIEEIAGGSSPAPVKPQKIAAPATDGEAEQRIQPRGITLSDAHRRVPPSETGPGTASPSAPVSFRVSAPAANAAQSVDPSRPDLDQIATTIAAMRGRMDQLALPGAKSPAPLPPTP